MVVGNENYDWEELEKVSRVIMVFTAASWLLSVEQVFD